MELSKLLYKAARLLKLSDSDRKSLFFAVIESALDQHGFHLTNHREITSRMGQIIFKSPDYVVKVDYTGDQLPRQEQDEPPEFQPNSVRLDFRKNWDRGSGRLNHKAINPHITRKLFSAGSVEAYPDMIRIYFNDLRIPNYLKLEQDLVALLGYLKSVFEEYFEEILHDCNPDAKPGMHSFEGIVYHGISKGQAVVDLAHIYTAPLNEHHEYGIDSISTTCNFKIADFFTEKSRTLPTVIKYHLKTDRLYVISAEMEAPDVKEILIKEAPDAFMIPLGGFIEHEIAVVNSAALKPIGLYINPEGTKYQYLQIPESEEEKKKFEEIFHKYRKEADIRIIQKSNEINALQREYGKEIERITWKSPALSATNNILGEGYQIKFFNVFGHAPVKIIKAAIQYLKEQFPLNFKYGYDNLIIEFDDIKLLMKYIKQIMGIALTIGDKYQRQESSDLGIF